MQVGDLVVLSSYGKKIITTTRVVGKDCLGIIICIDPDDDDGKYPYEVQWFNYDRPMSHLRQDLKYAK